jgi:hypothetical protein
MVTTIVNCFNIQTYIFLKECIYVLHTVLTLNSDC